MFYPAAASRRRSRGRAEPFSVVRFRSIGNDDGLAESKPRTTQHHLGGRAGRCVCTPAPMDYAKRLTRVSRQRQPSAIRRLMPYMSEPGMISLGGGLPNASLFPFTGVSVRLADTTLDLSPGQVADALQYSATPGLPSLLGWLRRLQADRHGVAVDADDGAARSICVTGGSQEAFSKAVEMLVEPTGAILVDDPCYSGVLAFLRPYGCQIVGVRTDHDGVDPDDLDRQLSSWAGPRPKPGVLYTNPTASNPTGATLSVARRHALYDVAEAHDLIILEDDPYYFLHPDQDALPSLLSLDRSNRVIRFDSFSKVLSSGLRVGFATGPSPLIERMNLHTQASNLHTSGLSQALVAALFDHWGLAGFRAHLARCARFYTSQRDALLAAADRHLAGLADWSAPQAGMFLWIRVRRDGIDDTRDLIERKALSAKVLFVPGQAFSAAADRPSAHLRASYSTASPADMDLAMRRLADLIRDE